MEILRRENRDERIKGRRQLKRGKKKSLGKNPRGVEAILVYHWKMFIFSTNHQIVDDPGAGSLA